MKNIKIACSLLLALSFSSANANTLSQLNVSAIQEKACLINAENIDFGIWDSNPNWTDRQIDKLIRVTCSKNAAYTISGSSPYLLPHGGIGRKLISNNSENSDFLIYNVYIGTSTARSGIFGSYSGETIEGINDKGVLVTHKLKVISSTGTGQEQEHSIVGRIYGVSVSLKSAQAGNYLDNFTLNISY